MNRLDARGWREGGRNGRPARMQFYGAGFEFAVAAGEPESKPGLSP